MKYLKLYEDFENYSDISTITIRFSSEFKQNEFLKHFLRNDKELTDLGKTVYATKNKNWNALEFDGTGFELSKDKNYTIALSDNNDNLKETTMVTYICWDNDVIDILQSNEHSKFHLSHRTDWKNWSNDYIDDLKNANARSTYFEFKNGLKVGEVDHRGYFEIIEIK